MEPKYTIERYDHGLVVRGSLPLSEIDALVKIGSSFGYDIMDPGIASALGASFMMTNASGSKIWREQIELEAQRKHPDPLMQWLSGPRVGISSQTIAHVLSKGRVQLSRVGPMTPGDGGDFGRCLHLVETMGWRDRLHEVAERFPEWSALIEHWDALSDRHRDGQDVTPSIQTLTRQSA